jgi:hypothetical protein
MPAPSSGNRPSKPVKLNAAKLFLGTLLSIAVLLSLLALQLSIQLARSSPNNVNVGPQLQNNNAAASSLVPDELKASVHITEKELLDKSGKYDKDRVYCMIPFIWNPKIYDVSKWPLNSALF